MKEIRTSSLNTIKMCNKHYYYLVMNVHVQQNLLSPRDSTQGFAHDAFKKITTLYFGGNLGSTDNILSVTGMGFLPFVLKLVLSGNCICKSLITYLYLQVHA